ncbi:MAG TPA: beta-propeller fold lactonase family protein [Candidatus Eisenbacteria bacterium]|nr:beta-propeller fold lactonase family protein [Candidatus Eisenbacteria bacterium]
MNLTRVVAIILLGLCATAGAAQTSTRARPQGGKEIPLPTSKNLLLPVPGGPQRTNSLPVTAAFSPDGKYLALLNNGYGSADSNYQQSIAILELASNQLRDFPDARLAPHARQSYFIGLAWSADGSEVYASIASLTDPEGKKADSTGNGIAVYRFAAGTLTPSRFLKLPLVPITGGRKNTYGAKYVPAGQSIPYPAGLAVVKRGGGDALLVAENLADDAVLIDTKDGRVLQRFDLGRGKVAPSTFPYGVVVNREGTRAWCSLWNGSSVAELDVQSGKVVREVALSPPKAETDASSHPTALLLSPDESQLYVALANRDRIAVVATADGKVERLLDARLPTQRYGGNYPLAVAQSADGKTLYVAESSSDAIGVFDLRESKGTHAQANADRAYYFIPTEWYPTALGVQGGELFVATGKGIGTGPNSGPEPVTTTGSKQKHPYIATLVRGSLARINLQEAERDHELLTAEVLRSNRMEGRTNQITFAHGSNPIRHVIYIIKENRTYDQIFGDIKEANGDASLVMYGEEITPNQHKLARQFGVLDNFYDSGEVSGDGHPWSMAAITTDYNEKAWPVGYRSKEREYDSEGTVGDAVPFEEGIPDVNEPATGYLFDNLARHKLTYRHYGEYIETLWCEELEQKYTPATTGAPTGKAPKCKRDDIKPGEDVPAAMGGGKSRYQYVIPLMARNIATKDDLRGHYDPQYPDFKVEYPDQFRVDEFLREFGGFVNARKTGKGEELPNFALVRLPNDHTAGTKPGSPTPNAAVADNDLAVGRVVEAISNSPYWDDTAIFVLEDDAQNGADHVDAHRSIALVVSKYSPRAPQPFVDHNFYTTVNMIHTMETLLGLPPMNNNDAHAPVMAPLFTGAGDQPTFQAEYRNRDNGMIYQANAKSAPGAKESAALDFSVADAADTETLNAILWRAAKGDVPMPEPRHAVIPSAGGEN